MFLNNIQPLKKKKIKTIKKMYFFKALVVKLVPKSLFLIIK